MLSEKQMYDTSEILLMIGGLNWGLVQFMDMNLVDMLPEMIRPFMYGAIGASAIYLAYIKFVK